MSCQLTAFASIVDLDKVKTCLFATDNEFNEDFGGDSWNWNIDDGQTSTGSTNNTNWLDDCYISLSPTSELLVLGREKNLVILKAKWDSSEESEAKIKYLLSWHGDPTFELSEKITCVLCLPIAAQGKLSAQGGADWTCIAVGFSSGAVRFYTEKGSLLLSEVFHNGKVCQIKCQTYCITYNPNLPHPNDELYVIYPSVVCSIEGFKLCNTLKTCRNQLARVEARCGDRIEPPPLALSKWSLPEQDTVNDVCVIGAQSTSGLSHLTTASIRGGYFAMYRSVPPQISTAIATGASPFVGFHCIIENTPYPLLSDVAKAVAIKFKSAIGQVVPGWLGGGRRPSTDKPKEKSIEAAEAMSCRFGICDYIRKGERLYSSPEKTFCVSCDSLGRVMLIDNISGLVLRMWKGYRDAQCAFIPIEERSMPGSGKRALYLVIYAPKKGIVEVWALQHGPKVATFLTTKTGKLLYINYGLLGVNSLSMKATNSSQHPCVFINENGIITQVSVPFHCILRSYPKSRDEHILKQVKRAFAHCNEQDILQLTSQLSTSKGRIKAIEISAKSKFVSPTLLEQMINEFTEKLSALDEDNFNESDEKCMKLCDNIQSIMKFYVMGVTLQEEPPRYSTVVPDSPIDDDEGLAKVLRLTKEETQRLLNFIVMDGERHSKTKVAFHQLDDKFHHFLNAFFSSLSDKPPFVISPNLSSHDLAHIGEHLCQCVLYGSCTVDSWKRAAFESNIDPSSLLHTAICYWLNKPLGSNARSELILFMQLMSALTSLSNQREKVEFWECIRSVITGSTNITNALTAAVISRCIYLNIEDQFSVDENDSDWETVSKESYEWSQLISQVEAVALLQSTLSYKPNQQLQETHMPRLEYVKPDFSLSFIINKGPGSVCESVAKWICCWGLKPEWLSTPEKKAAPSRENIENETGSIITGASPVDDVSIEARETIPAQDVALELLNDLRKQFPYSLASGPLVAGQAWEYISAWAHDPDQIRLFTVLLASLNNIVSHHLRQGLCSIIWNVHLKSKFEASVRLLQKVGKLPKEKLCRQELNMSDTNVQHYLKHLFDFLETFIESAIAAEASNEMTKIKVEPLWSGCEPSLANICLAQALPNTDVLRIQAQCVSSLLLLAGLPIRLHRPINALFDSYSETCLWRDIKNQSKISIKNADVVLQQARLAYLNKAITAAIEPLSSPEGNIRSTAQWTSRIFSLARCWDLPLDELRITQICQYYLNNQDIYAEEVFGTVNDKNKLGNELLKIVGRRMNTIMNSSEEEVFSLAPSLENWVQKHESLKLTCSVRDTVHLSRRVTQLLDEDTPLFKFSLFVYESIESVLR